MRNNKGFTLIELIIVVAIMGVIMTATSSFFISNLRSFTFAKNQFDTQHNSAMVTDDIARQLMECHGIESIDNINGEYIFFVIKSDGTRKYIKYEYDDVGDRLGRGIGDSLIGLSVNETATNIREFKIRLMKQDNTEYSTITTNALQNAKGIKLTIKSEANSVNLDINNTIFFRNK